MAALFVESELYFNVTVNLNDVIIYLKTGGYFFAKRRKKHSKEYSKLIIMYFLYRIIN